MIALGIVSNGHRPRDSRAPPVAALPDALPDAPPGAPPVSLHRALGTLDLVLLNVAAIISFRWLSIAAQIGPSSLTLWLLGMLTFFVPSALTVLELSARLPGEGGLYVWSKEAFGERHAFIVGWSYWIANLAFFPSLLLFIAGVCLHVGGGHWLSLAGDPLYNGGVCLALLWLAIGLNIVGLDRAKWLQNIGGAATWVVGVLILACGAYAWHRFGAATALTARSLLPDLGSLAALGTFSAMALAYVGLELGPILGGEIKHPERTIARATLMACGVVPLIYLSGTAALLVALPPGEVDMITGIPQAAAAIGARIGVPAIAAVTALFVALSQVGTLGAWVTGTTRLPFLFGLDRYLPAWLGELHPRFGSPHKALLTQGVLTSLILLAAVSGSRIHDAFRVLIDMSIILSFVPLIYMFAALPVLRRRADAARLQDRWRIPGGFGVCAVVAASGIAVTLLGVIVAAIPPPGNLARTLLFGVKVIGGSTLLVAVGVLCYARAQRRRAA